MKKIFFLIALSFIFTSQLVIASETPDDITYKQVLKLRSDIQEQLNFSEKQAQKRAELNAIYYPKINSKFEQIDEQIQKINNLVQSENCTIEQVDIIKKDFKLIETELSEINRQYEHEFRATLSLKQKVKYSKLKRQNRKILKKELKEKIKSAKQ